MVTVVSFYPGAGGNRYYLHSINPDLVFDSLTAYDSEIKEQTPQLRYLTSDSKLSNIPSLLLTHCMNTKLIKQMIPDSSITVIMSNLRDSLRREWKLAGHGRYALSKPRLLDRIEHYNALKDQSWPDIKSDSDFSLLPQHILTEVDSDYLKLQQGSNTSGDLVRSKIMIQVESAAEIINWHNSYYTDYPVDLSCADQVIDINKEETTFSIQMLSVLNQYTSDIFDQVWDELYKQ